MSNVFYAPASISGSYVASQRTDSGSFAWNNAASDLGMQKQQALQSLNQQYDTTINNAYSNYLMSRRGVQGSNMGEGYKEAYMQMQEEGLQQQVAQTNMNAANARGEIEQQGANVQAQLQAQYQQEVANMDRISNSMKDYYNYLKGLMPGQGMKPGSSIFTEQQLKQGDISLDGLYDYLLSAPTAGYLDEKGNRALSYMEWTQQSLGKTTADSNWWQWLTTGGMNNFRTMLAGGIEK